MDKKRILLGHLNSNGDCLFASVIARQIKEADYPNCHLTWAVNRRCRQTVFLNPYVDDIWEIPTEKTLTNEDEWKAFVGEAENKKRCGEFDLIFFTQIIGENWFKYDGGIRSSTYNNYPHRITVPHQPIIKLTETETENVGRFAEKHRLDEYKRVILIESAPDSFEVALTSQAVCELALETDFDGRETAFIISSNKPVYAARPNIIDASELTFRENAELTKYCDLFVGCASGISWLATTDWAKKLDMILIIAQDNHVLPSMIYDHDYLRLPTEHIIEIKSDEHSLKKLRNCLNAVSADGFAAARQSFNERIKLSNYSYLDRQLDETAKKLKFVKFFSCLLRSIRRNGIKILFTSQFRCILRNLRGRLRNKLLKLLGLKTDDVLINERKR